MAHGDPPHHQPSYRAMVAQRRARAIELKNRGMSWQQVAEAMAANYPEYRDSEGNPSAAVDRLLRIEERQAKIDGTDASEKLTIALDRRVDEETAVVVESILAGANAVDLEPAQRQRMLEAAGAHLRTLEGEVVGETEDPS
jgi:hypothetical protein